MGVKITAMMSTLTDRGNEKFLKYNTMAEHATDTILTY